MKKLFCFLLVVLLLISLPLTVLAAICPISDSAEILSGEEETALVNVLTGYGDRTAQILTVNSLEGEDIEDFAEQFAEDNRIGVLMVIAMSERKWCITSSDAYQGAIDGEVIDRISAQCVPYLRTDDYYSACMVFAEECGYYLDGYDPAEAGEEGGGIFVRILICLLIGLAVGSITAGIMAGLNKSVRTQRGAANYVRSGSMQLTASRDVYLYHHIARTPKPQSSSSSGSVGGGSRSTRSGGF